MEILSGQLDIVVLTETHLNDSVADSEIFPSNFTVFRRDRQHRGRNGGGVLIAVRDIFKFHHRDDIVSEMELL